MKKIFFVCALFALAVSTLANPTLLASCFAPDKHISYSTTMRIHSLQLLFFVFGFFFIGIFFLDMYSGISKSTRLIKSISALLPVVSIIFFLFVFETGLRVLGFIPNPFETNEAGLRGMDIPLENAPNSYRILFLGDSVTFGVGVSSEESYVARLDQMFQEHHSSIKFKALNGGLPGYSTYDELNFLRNQGLQLKPDLVLLAFVLNDLAENTSVIQSQGGEEGMYGVSLMVKIHKFLSFHSSLYTALRTLNMYIRSGSTKQIFKHSVKWENEEVNKFLVSSYTPEQEKIWQGITNQLTFMKNLLKEQKINMGLIIFPWHYQWDQTAVEATPQKRLKEWGQEEGVPVLDLLPFLTTHPLKSVLIDHCHLKPFGHELAAKAIYNFLFSDGRLLEGIK